MANILVVDDRKLNREFLAMLLGYAGHRVVEASDGMQALERVREARPDLVITDIVMPTLDGIDFVKQLHSDPATMDVPVIFYTATYRLDEASRIAETLGVKRVIAKPSRPRVILDAVATVLGVLPAQPLPARREAEAPRPKGSARKLSEAMESLSLRLATLIEASIDLAAERDPQRLLDFACGTAAAVCLARVTAIGMVGAGGAQSGHLAVRGATDEVRRLIGEIDFGAVVADGLPHRFNDPVAAAAVLPPWPPPVDNLMIVPMKSATRSYGWLYLADRDGAASFGDDDEQLAMTLATQVTQAYENLSLYRQASAYADQLEAEIEERRQAQSAQRDSEAHFRAVFDHAPIGMAVMSAAGRFVRVNCALCALLGYAKGDLEKASFEQVVTADEPTAASAPFAGQGEDVEMRFLRRDGSTGWMLFRASVLRDEAGDPQHFIAQFTDISERKRTEEDLRLAASVFEHTKDAILVTDTEPRIISVNPAFTAITGYSAEEVIGHKPNIMGSEQTTPEFYRELWETLLRDGHWEGEIWNRRKSGDAFLEWLVISMIPGPDGKPARYVGISHDITELRRKDEHIRHLAFHDPLTGLPNRALLLDRLEHGLAVAEREKQRLALMFVDLDRFKTVNDSLGHEAGDRLLKETAQRLNLCVRHSDTIARMGGDEFVILLDHAADLGDYAVLAHKVVTALSQPVDLGGHVVTIGASVGIACFPSDGTSVFDLVKSADAAMYAAKAAGRGTYRFFHPALGESAAERAQLESELRSAAANRQLELYYQPTVLLGSDVPFGIEALLRWRHPERGLILPADFIPLAEETGIIAELGDWVIDEACRQCSAWQAQGLGRIRITVTVAAKQIQHGDLAARIVGITLRHGLSPSNLEIKLTESVMLAARQHVEDFLGRMREIGVTVAVNDYGSGASSLAYLRRLPIDMLRIDRSLVRRTEDNKEDQEFVKSLLALGQALKLTVVAEGVETETQADFLRASGCTLGQGYLYAQPVPAADVEVWLRRRPRDGAVAQPPNS